MEIGESTSKKLEEAETRTEEKAIMDMGCFYHTDTRYVVVVVDPPLLRVSVEGSDNPISSDSPARRPSHLASRGTTLQKIGAWASGEAG